MPLTAMNRSTSMQLLVARTQRLARCAWPALAMLVSAAALGQSSGGPFSLTRHVVLGGGHASGGVFVLDGTIGQHDATTVRSGGVFALTGGFRHGAGLAPGDRVFQDGFE